jgi:hypothetical protein
MLGSSQLQLWHEEAPQEFWEVAEVIGTAIAMRTFLVRAISI